MQRHRRSRVAQFRLCLCVLVPSARFETASQEHDRLLCLALLAGLARGCDGCPTLGNLVALETPLHKAVELHRRPAFDIFPSPDITTHYPVTLSHHVLDGDMKTWHEIVHPAHHVLVLFYSRRLVTGSVVIVKIRGHVVANYLRLFVVDEILEVLAHKHFHFFRGQMGRHVLFFHFLFSKPCVVMVRRSRFVDHCRLTHVCTGSDWCLSKMQPAPARITMRASSPKMLRCSPANPRPRPTATTGFT